MAVVPIEREASAGSYIKIPPQRILDVGARKRIIVDEHSGRILVDQELAIEEQEKVEKLVAKELKAAALASMPRGLSSGAPMDIISNPESGAPLATSGLVAYNRRASSVEVCRYVAPAYHSSARYSPPNAHWTMPLPSSSRVPSMAPLNPCKGAGPRQLLHPSEAPGVLDAEFQAAPELLFHGQGGIDVRIGCGRRRCRRSRWT